jgi:DNA-binding winged helix-turn-helix (wHTH) protein
MPLPAEKSRVVRFGVFEVDLQEAELRKSGIRIKLHEQPFQILARLLERQGQTVSREELRHKLWPTDTFVDFDHSLNSSINKLREALGDSSENPRFIETLHRRGYRFIAPVDWAPAAVAEPVRGTAPRCERRAVRERTHGSARADAAT